MGRVANLHTLPIVYSASLYAALTSQSEISFLVPLQIPGLSKPISTLTIVNSGMTSNFIDLSLETMPYLYPQHWPNPSHCASSTASLLHQDSSLSLSRPLYTFRTNQPRLLNFLSQSFTPRPRSSSDCHGFEAPTPSSTGPPCCWHFGLAPSRLSQQ